MQIASNYLKKMLHILWFRNLLFLYIVAHNLNTPEVYFTFGMNDFYYHSHEAVLVRHEDDLSRRGGGLVSRG